MEEIAKNIKHYRNRSQYTQADLARLLNVHVKYISALERGKNQPGKEVVALLCDALGISEQQLRFGERQECRCHQPTSAERALVENELSDLSQDELLEVTLLLRKQKAEWRRQQTQIHDS
jgi:transcriptional regulator with XRE-family HTH domain